MKILVVGGGGREHAIVWKLSQSPRVSRIYCAPGNGGIASMAECIEIEATDLDGITVFAREKEIDLTVVAPDDPLAHGNGRHAGSKRTARIRPAKGCCQA